MRAMGPPSTAAARIQLSRIGSDGERDRPDEVRHEHGRQQADARQQGGCHDDGELIDRCTLDSAVH